MHRRPHGRFAPLIAAIAFALLAAPAFATFHLFRIQQIYSNADGTIQFVVLRESFGQDGENLWKGHAISSGSSSGTHTYTFPTDLPDRLTAGKYVLVATDGFAALNLVTPDYVVPNNFLWTGKGNVDFADVDFVAYAALPSDGVSALDRNKNAIPNVATNYAGQSGSVTAAMAGGGGAAAKNYQGLWWNAPADSESGWGINFTHQGDVIFATWFTYDATGKAWWLAMTANKTADATYGGVLFDATGPAFSAVPFDSSKFKPTAVGNGTLHFTDENNGTFSYTVNGIAQTKAITRQVFATAPTCVSAAKLDPATATNYQDLWWNAPAGSESGWGINLTHQGDVIFATWFTYASDGTPLWLSVSAFKTAERTYSGDLARTTGPAFNAVPFDSKAVAYTKVGSATFAFTSGNQGTFTYTVNGITQTKTITRQVFASPATVCTTAPINASAAAGVWSGTTNLNEGAFALLLDDGRFEFVYAKAGTSDDIAVLIGTAGTNGGTLSSADSTSYPIAQTAESTGFAAPASVSGTIVPGGALNFTVTTPVSTRSFAGSFVQGSDEAPSLADLAGTYGGSTGHVGGRRDASMTIDAAGNVRGSNDALCAFVGTVTPRAAVRAFDWTIHANNLNCIFGRGPISGILYYDPVTRRLHAFAPFSDNVRGADQYFFVGTKAN